MYDCDLIIDNYIRNILVGLIRFYITSNFSKNLLILENFNFREIT